MSLESSRDEPGRAARAFKVAFVLLAILFVSLVFAAILSACLYARMEGTDSAFDKWVREEPHKVMRRVMTLIALCGVPVFLKVAGWKGWRDCGIRENGDPRQARRALIHFRSGVVLGLCTLIPLVAFAVLADLRTWSPRDSAGVIVLALALAVLRSVWIGIFEEVVARGVLFRVLARTWTLWPALLVSSALFAYLHFFKASSDAFTSDVTLNGIFEIISSAFQNPGRTEQFEIRFFNLTLMSMVLCLMVARTGTIWLAAGTHAGWVCVKLANRLLTKDVSGDVELLWIGHRSDATDGLLTSFLLLALIIVWWQLVRRDKGTEA